MGRYYEKILTRKLAPVLGALGMGYLTRPVYSGRGHILMFHRVIPLVPGDRIHNHLSLEITPDHLQQVIAYFRKKKYDFLSLDVLPGWLAENKNTGRKFVIFTFDDGYKDNLDFAYPILRKNKVPFTIYVTDSFPDQRAIIWWYMLEDLILKNNRIQYQFTCGTVNVNCYTIREKESAFSTFRDIFTVMDEESRDRELAGFFARYGIDAAKYNHDLALSWDEIAGLSGDPLVGIGAHTLNHYNLCALSDELAYHEISGSGIHIGSKTGHKVSHFCYPLGQYGLREKELVKSSNYITATTTKTGNIFDKHSEHLFSLPRITVNSLSNEKILDLQTYGFFPAILNKLKRVIY